MEAILELACELLARVVRAHVEPALAGGATALSDNLMADKEAAYAEAKRLLRAVVGRYVGDRLRAAFAATPGAGKGGP